MKPTDNERREVAARLRRMAEKHGGVVWFLVERYLGLVPDERYLGGSVYTSESVSRLADLIEPEPERTCRMDEIKTGELADYRDTDEVIFHCMSCHADRGIFSYDEDGNVYSEPPKYCPNCGAKITTASRLADLISPCGGRASEVDEHDARHSNQDSCHQSSAGC